MQKIKVLIVDDHSLFRDGLRSVLERQAELAIVGEAGDADTGVRLVGELQPDVILMDLHMPGRSGIDAIREIVRQHPRAAIIALSMYEDAELVQNAVLAGARGYLLKDSRAVALADGIRAVAAGGVALDPQIGSRLLDEFRRLAGQAGHALPDEHAFARREIEVLELLAAGLTNKQIADTVHLSEQTIKNLLSMMYQKLGVENRTEAVLEAIGRGLVKPKR